MAALNLLGVKPPSLEPGWFNSVLRTLTAVGHLMSQKKIVCSAVALKVRM